MHHNQQNIQSRVKILLTLAHMYSCKFADMPSMGTIKARPAENLVHIPTHMLVTNCTIMSMLGFVSMQLSRVWAESGHPK